MIRGRAVSRAGLGLLLFLVPLPAAAFGFAAHRLAHQKAAEALPAPLRELFLGNVAYLREHAIEPDLWAIAAVPGEGPNHYLDADAFGPMPFDTIPLSEDEHRAKNGPKAATEGRVPWRVGELYRQLVAAFRQRDPACVLELAAVLGHYVEDAHVPLHSVVNYDGQLTGQRGVHGRWETEMFTRFERQIEPAVRPAPAEGIADPVAAIFAVLRESFAAAPLTLAADRETAGTLDLAATVEDDRYDDGYYSRFFEREGERFKARLTAAAHLTGSLWYSAWVEAGRPAIDGSFRFPYVRGQAPMVVALLEGAPAGAVAEAAARGLLPSLEALRRRGAGATKVVGSSTASAMLSGSDQPGAEPLWIAAARQGLDVTTVLAPDSWPFAPYLGGRRFGGNFGRSLTLLTDRGERGAADVVLASAALRPAAGWKGAVPASPDAREITVTVAGATVDGLLFDDPADPAAGFDTLLLAVDKDAGRSVRLKPRPAGEDASANLAVSSGALTFRLFALAPDGASLLLYGSPSAPLESSRERVAAAALQATGGLPGRKAVEAYARGAFGPRAAAGGDGAAEARSLEIVRLGLRQVGRLAEFAAKRTRWDLLVVTLAFPTDALEAWRGDPGRDRSVDAVWRAVDEQVAALASLAGDRGTVAFAAPGYVAAAGPLAAAGKDLAGLRTIDVAPTLAALAGLDPPAQAQGVAAR